MTLCDLTLPSPAENLACDEALLDLCEHGSSDEVLRFWEPANYFVVLGYANKAPSEANLAFCAQNSIPVLRRCTGGGAVLQGPGVLNYSLILRIDTTGPCRSIAAANEFVMNRHRTTLAVVLNAPVEVRGHTDLALGGLKFSGNAQRRKKRFLIFHGSFLLHFDAQLMEQSLPFPSKQPDYRLSRSHSEFLMDLRIDPSILKSALQKAWNAIAPLESKSILFNEISRLTTEKYNLHDWNFKF